MSQPSADTYVRDSDLTRQLRAKDIRDEITSAIRGPRTAAGVCIGFGPEERAE